MATVRHCSLLSRVSAGIGVLFLMVPTALPRGSVGRLLCYVVAMLSLVVCAISAWRLRDGHASLAATDGGILNDAPLVASGSEMGAGGSVDADD